MAKEKSLVFPHFDDIEVSTQTFVVDSNLVSIDLSSLFLAVPFSSEMINLSYQDRVRVPEKEDDVFYCGRRCCLMHEGSPPTDPPQKTKRNFLNCISVNISVEKKINMKIFNNGVFQLTGCKRWEQARSCVLIMWRQMSSLASFYSFGLFPHPTIQLYFRSVMRNFNFNLPIRIHRENFGLHVHHNTECKVLPITKGYMGVKLKILLPDVSDLPVRHVTAERDGQIVGSEGETRVMTYEYFLKHIMERQEKKKVPRYISMSVFENGKVLMSGMDAVFQRPHYNWFVDYIRENKEKVWVPPKQKQSFYRPGKTSF